VRVRRAGEASHSCPWFNHFGDVGEERQFHSLAGELPFALLSSTFLNSTPGVIKDDSIRAFLLAFKQRG
jgi:hypothetical protein